MPLLQVMRCPVCGTQSDAYMTMPEGWILVNIPSSAGTVGRQEVFDRWECLHTFVGEQVPRAT